MFLQMKATHQVKMNESDTSSEDECECTTALPVARKKKNINKSSKTAQFQADLQSVHMRMTVNEVPPSVKQVLRTLHQCKKVVKHVKKVSE